MPTTRLELILLIAYIVLGPMTWGFYGLMLHAGRKKMRLLRRPVPPIEEPIPSVTILIPAKDEGQRIRACVESALAQDYPGELHVIAINDRSTDDTGAVMDELAAGSNGRLKVLHIVNPPEPGWTGKNNALWQGQKLATTDWLLFVDSDVVLQPDVLSAAMPVALRKKFDLISILPRLESHTIWESLLVPLAASAASSMYLIALTNANYMSNTAFANGQFILMSRKSYDAFGGHEKVRDRYCEDVEIARLLKTSGWRPRVGWGTDFAAVRMYSSLDAIFRGWSRIYYAAQVGSPWRVLAAATFVIFCGFSVYAAFAWGAFQAWHGQPVAQHWLTAAGIHLVVMTTFLGLLYHWSGNPWRNALMFPVGGSMLLAIFARALRMCITKKVEWRGTAYSHTMASTLAPSAAAPENETRQPAGG